MFASTVPPSGGRRDTRPAGQARNAPSLPLPPTPLATIPKTAAGGALIPLGIRGESIHAAPADTEKVNRDNRLAARTGRFRLLRTAQTLLYDPDVTADRQHATCWCHRTTTSHQGNPPIFRSVDGSSARLGGVVTCGMVWTCPVCCAKVAEQRRHELSRAMAAHVSEGGGAYLVTFTLPHTLTDRLAVLLDGLELARQRFQNSRLWKRWKETAQRLGGVTSLETTIGTNGWHPHLHMLVFTHRGAFDEGDAAPNGDLMSPLIVDMAAQWVKQLQRVNLVERGQQLTDALRHSFNVRGGARASEYVAKYGRDERHGISAELTRAHAKTAGRRLGPRTWHLTPFQLLHLIGEGDTEHAPAWREYVEAFAGRRMLTWTPGLKARFGIDEKADDAAAAEGMEAKADENWVASLSHVQFVQVHACAMLGPLLEFVARYGGQVQAQWQVDAWIREHCRMPVASGEVRRRFEASRKYTTLPPNAPRPAT